MHNNIYQKDYRLEKIVLLLALLILVPQILFGVHLSRIIGNSMAPNFVDGECVLSMPVHHAALKRGDVITFYPDESSNNTYIKRIVGLPGETIQARDSTIFIDGQEIDFSWGTGTWGPVLIPDNSVFLLGDNRPVSCDSRILGPISFWQIDDKIIGKSVLLS